MNANDRGKLPRHLAIIMDGNGRWARSRGLPRMIGHREGAKSVRKIVTACRERGISVLTLFAFSSENWSRPSPEVEALMELLAEYVDRERKTIMDNEIRLTAIGDIARLPDRSRAALFFCWWRPPGLFTCTRHTAGHTSRNFSCSATCSAISPTAGHTRDRFTTTCLS